MSVQDLSDAVESLGVTIQRPVLSNFENGRRGTIAAAELHAIAAALRVPPLLLEYPIGRVERIEVLPGVEVSPWHAAQWAMGHEDLPVSTRSSDNGGEILRLFQLHDENVRAAVRSRQSAQQIKRETATQPADEAAMNEASRDFDLRAHAAESTIRYLRVQLRRDGLIPPDLPVELRHIDGPSFHPPQLVNLPFGAPE